MMHLMLLPIFNPPTDLTGEMIALARPVSLVIPVWTIGIGLVSPKPLLFENILG